jgi:prepilin-type N-terminal cleavage/methylation domain-containing protein
MKFPKLNLMKKGQKGFTLIELAIAMAIGSMIAGAVTMTIFQIVESSGRTSNHMTAVRQVQSAGYWVSRDAQMIQQEPVIVNDGASGELVSITLDWTDWDGNVFQVVYTLEDMSVGSLKELKRVEDKDTGSGTVTDTKIVAEFIDPDPAKTSCVYDDGTFTFRVTVQVGAGPAAQIEARVYEAIPRPGS